MTSRNQRLQNDLIEWRQREELTKLSTGKSMTEIAQELKVDISTVSKDLKKMRLEAKEKHGEYIDNLPFDHLSSIASVKEAHDELWKLYRNEKDSKRKESLLNSVGEMVIKLQILRGDDAIIERMLETVVKAKKQFEEEVNSEAIEEVEQ